MHKSSDDLYAEELGELNTPYSESELERHAKDRELKSAIEWLHGHNWQLITIAKETIDYLNGKGEMPLYDISRYAYPGYIHDHNAVCTYIEQLGECIIRYGEGACPMLRVVTYCSRSTITLIALLKEIHCTPELIAAEQTAMHIFRLLTCRNPPSMSAEKFAVHVRECCKRFIDACMANAAKLGDYYNQRKREIEHPAAPSQQPATKGDLAAATDRLETVAADTNHRVRKLQHETNGHKRFTDKQLKTVAEIWERAKHNPEVKANCKGKSTYNATFTYYIRELRAVGITNDEQFRAAKKEYSRQINK